MKKWLLTMPPVNLKGIGFHYAIDAGNPASFFLHSGLLPSSKFSTNPNQTVENKKADPDYRIGFLLISFSLGISLFSYPHPAEPR